MQEIDVFSICFISSIFQESIKIDVPFPSDLV